MTEKYSGKAMDRRYSGEAVDISYSLKRCIHAEACIHRLSEVFDAKRRPWIMPDGSDAEQVAQTIESCPSGALHYERKDGGAGEASPESNSVHVWHNGPLQFNANLHIEGTTVEIHGETRATLCRCGASRNKPFCDNSHKEIGFDGTTAAAGITAVPSMGSGPLTVTVSPNGSLSVKGAFTLYDESGTVLFSGEETWLCRCGGSAKKPFCDGTHNRNGFTGE